MLAHRLGNVTRIRELLAQRALDVTPRAVRRRQLEFLDRPITLIQLLVQARHLGLVHVGQLEYTLRLVLGGRSVQRGHWSRLRLLSRLVKRFASRRELLTQRLDLRGRLLTRLGHGERVLAVKAEPHRLRLREGDLKFACLLLPPRELFTLHLLRQHHRKRAAHRLVVRVRTATPKLGSVRGRSTSG